MMTLALMEYKRKYGELISCSMVTCNIDISSNYSILRAGAPGCQALEEIPRVGRPHYPMTSLLALAVLEHVSLLETFEQQFELAHADLHPVALSILE